MAKIESVECVVRRVHGGAWMVDGIECADCGMRGGRLVVRHAITSTGHQYWALTAPGPSGGVWRRCECTVDGREVA